ncbi:MAG: DUF7453 family protein [Pirellulaceae bacterium]
MTYRLIILLVVTGLAVTTASEALGQFTITRIADTSTQMPGQAFNFDGFGGVSINGNDVSFAGRSNTGYQGIFVSQSGTLNTVIDTNTTIPGTSDTFTQFLELWAENGNYAITGLDQNSVNGVYRWDGSGGGLSTVANAGTDYPGGFGNFGFFDSATISETGMIGFEGGSNFSNTGVYTHSGSTLTEVANESTAIPGGTGNFTGFSSVRTDGNSVTLIGEGSSGQVGIYSDAGGSLAAVVDTSDTVPGSAENFSFFQQASVDAGQTLLFGAGTTIGGIYLEENGMLTTVVDNFTTIPGTAETFASFAFPEIEDGNLAFFGGGTTTPISLFFQEAGGSLQRVISEGDSLDGRTVQLLLWAPDAIDGTNLVFHTLFTDGSRGVYFVDTTSFVPEPASTVFLLGGSALFFFRRRVR